MAIQRYRYLLDSVPLGNRSQGERASRSPGHGRFGPLRRLRWVALAAGVAVVAAGSSSSSTSAPPASSAPSSGAAPSSSAASGGSAAIPSGLGTSSFTVDVASTMSQLKGLTAAATKGASSLQVGVILPDTTSSTRYVDFDAPSLKEAFTDAGYTSSQFKIDNAQGSDATELSLATADISAGARVLVVDELDNPTGVAVAKLAESKGVTLIAYDRAIFQGSSTYYVSFNNEQVGELIGQGFEACVKALNIAKPKVYVLNGGEDTDSNSIAFATGYNKVVWGEPAKTVAAGKTNSLGYSLVAENFAPGWDNTKGGTIFQQAYTANPSINATIEANDGLANAVITDLKAAGVKANTVPTVGQDATAQGMAWILQGYQCGSVYKAIYKEAQDAVAMATILLAGQKPPPALQNGTTVDPANSSITEPASLLTPVWVTKANMESTVVKDGFDTAKAICALAGASTCSAAGIS
jgi:D-xylose transport system substrate-binding protein